MQSGELFVIGKDKAVIHLRDFPSHLVVSFKDECEIIPCNPHHYDSLEWEVCLPHHHHHTHHSTHHFTLVIKWQVTGVREIHWAAYY